MTKKQKKLEKLLLELIEVETKNAVSDNEHLIPEAARVLVRLWELTNT